ncbi:hypothetical protein XELAEV_18012507mg [Xenopus laevis]|uniref:Uncharacterized protein n=1 Tax=Xenopus laevis TaxID=8355 RepID=A0A974DPL5_XENLA|nr:hypothetical protein XELAEV_18012507mg [Xenopus laevis]
MFVAPKVRNAYMNSYLTRPACLWSIELQSSLQGVCVLKGGRIKKMQSVALCPRVVNVIDIRHLCFES